jgi:cellulose biosynthesis protein BcsQ
MKIKIAILDQDENYLSRLAAVFTGRFMDKLEVYSFTDANVALREAALAKINVFLASEAVGFEPAALPERCGFAWLVETAGIESVKGARAICKYQKADGIYREILELFSETVPDSVSIRSESGRGAALIAFAPVSGGTGGSTAAAAFAMSLARKGKRALYLNTELFGDSGAFFSAADVRSSFSDVIFAVKNRRSNLALKIESCAAQDQSGVCFFAPAREALDVMELTGADVELLAEAIKGSGLFDAVVADADFSLGQAALALFRQSDAIALVSDGSDISNRKFRRAVRAIELMEQQKPDLRLLSRLVLLYNKFGGASAQLDGDSRFATAGRLPRTDRQSAREIALYLSQSDVFDRLGV